MSEKNSKNATPNSTKSKPSTESAIATKNEKNAKNRQSKRWLRLNAPSSELFEINRLLDLYWGGSERRLTGLTMRIIAVNAVALLILMIGIMYLGQYQERLIETRLETYEVELNLVASALSEKLDYDPDNIEKLGNRLTQSLTQNIYVFSPQGELLYQNQQKTSKRPRSMQSVEVLKSLGRALLEIVPAKRQLPAYPVYDMQNINTIPDIPDALSGHVSVSVWQGQHSRFFLSAATPLFNEADQKIHGALLMTREATDIEHDINRVWLDVLRIFTITLILTTLLSIYLSGVIARPLKKLARAAEAVRKGKATADEIPDLSARHDEIGELSLVLRQMTHALWNKMDATERFAADVSHELKNPLTSLRSAIETLQIVKKKADREKLLQVITHDLERLDRLITDISNASRLDSELSREVFQKLNLKTLLNALIDMHKDPLARQGMGGSTWDNEVKIQGIRVNLQSTAFENIDIMGVESRLMQVFENILSNALSFAPPSSEVTISVHDFENTASIIFEDRGPGIPENKRETVFERFYSQRPAHEDYGRHSGLGLSICKQIVEAHGGKIKADNITNKKDEITGARFTVILKKA